MYKKIYRNMCLLALITLLLSAGAILYATYTQFDNRIKAEIQQEAQILVIGIHEAEDGVAYLKSVNNTVGDKRITLISKDGEVLYENNSDPVRMDNHGDRPEILDAKQGGAGESIRNSTTLGTRVYYYAVKLDNGDILRISSATSNIFHLFVGALLPIVLTLGVIYIVITVLAVTLTDKIISPINHIDLDDDNYDDVYEELVPFLQRVVRQRKEIQGQMQKIERQKLRLNAISENMNEGLLVLDKAGTVLSANNSLLDLFGVSPEDILKKNYIYLTRDMTFSQHAADALDGRQNTEVFHFDGKSYQGFFNPVFENNQVSGAIILFFDISEKEKAEMIRREFSANVSHELKTPLTTILGYSQMLHNGMAKPEDVENFASKIEKEAARLITLIEDIIKLSSLDEQVETNQTEPVNLTAIARDVAESLSKQAQERQIAVNVHGEDIYIEGNRSQLTELVFNLCDNAIKYNKEGGKVDITVADGKISVSDTGIGISEENRDRIFERFYRVDKSRSKKVNGTGLGLSIVKHIALCHNAKISVDSQLSKGTDITVDFQ